jgi:hypothetical protein
MRRYIQLGILVAIVAVAAASAFRIYQLNSEYPPPATKAYALGETVSAGDVTLAAQDAYFVNPNQMQEMFPEFDGGLIENGKPLAPERYKIFLVVLKVNNESDRDQQVDLRFYLQSGAWSNGADPFLFQQTNGGSEGLIRTIGAHEEIVLRCPYLLYDFMFKNSGDWERVESRSYRVVLSNYPTQHVIQVYG